MTSIWLGVGIKESMKCKTIALTSLKGSTTCVCSVCLAYSHRLGVFEMK